MQDSGDVWGGPLYTSALGSYGEPLCKGVDYFIFRCLGSRLGGRVGRPSEIQWSQPGQETLKAETERECRTH